MDVKPLVLNHLIKFLFFATLLSGADAFAFLTVAETGPPPNQEMCAGYATTCTPSCGSSCPYRTCEISVTRVCVGAGADPCATTVLPTEGFVFSASKGHCMGPFTVPAMNESRRYWGSYNGKMVWKMDLSRIPYENMMLSFPKCTTASMPGPPCATTTTTTLPSGCPSGMEIITAAGADFGKCSLCLANGNEQVWIPGTPATLERTEPNGCAACDDPTQPCANFANCAKLRKCIEEAPANNDPFIQNSSAGSMTTSCGATYSTLSCVETPEFYARVLRVADSTNPADAYDPMPTRSACVGAPTTTTTTTTIACVPDTSTCVATNCPGGWSNTHPGSCPAGQSVYVNDESPGVHPYNVGGSCTPGQLACNTGLCYQCQTPPSGGGGCFVAGTQVQMSDGSAKAIEEVQPGEEVVTYDEVTGEVRKDVVTGLHHHSARQQQLYRFELENGKVFTANDIHPIYIHNMQIYMETAEIYLNWLSGLPLSFQDIDGNPVQIHRILTWGEKVPVYNLHIKGIERYNKERGAFGRGHNYYIEGILVHNPIQKL